MLDPCSLVIFGASGDLTFRKLIPAIFALDQSEKLGEHFIILGTGRSEYSDDSYREHLLENVGPLLSDSEQSAFPKFLERVFYQVVDSHKEEDFHALKSRIASVNPDAPDKVLFYLATPPSLFHVIPKQLASVGLANEDKGWKRLVIEKPLGTDVDSAEKLDNSFHEYFAESQLYRIDHYLGKEAVQNLLVFRFANGMFEPLWNRKYIDYVEITAAEALGVEGRGGYYDGAGAVRDMLQNHLLQVLAMVAMEPPAHINADAIRNETAKALQSLKPLTEADLDESLVLGQYTASVVKGKAKKGYREQKGVAPDSRTETYVALKLFIHNWRWNGIPFYVRTGKRLPTRVTEVVINFKSTPHPEFAGKTAPNKLIIRIQPDEGIVIRFGLKQPGAGFETRDVSMDFSYGDLEEANILSAYERLLLDAMQGDATLFARSDAVAACWQFVQPILDYKEDPQKLFGYACGTWGPEQADKLLQEDGRVWRSPCKNLADTDYCEL